jgi:hypothetical protein
MTNSRKGKEKATDEIIEEPKSKRLKQSQAEPVPQARRQSKRILEATKTKSPASTLTQEPKTKRSKTSQVEALESYKVKSTEGNIFFSKPFEHAPNSTLNPIEKSGVEKDRTAYARLQSSHPNHNPNAGQMSDNLSRIAKDLKMMPKTGLLANSADPFNFGLNFQATDAINLKEFSHEQVYRNPISSQTLSKCKRALDDEIIKHKNQHVKNLVNKLKDMEGGPLLVGKNQLSAKYPCLIIRFNEGYALHRSILKETVTNEIDGYSKLLTNIVIAYINKNLIENNLKPLIDRRQSFGFLTPTASDVKTGIRLSLGLVPNSKWDDVVANGIRESNDVLAKLWQNNILTAGTKVDGVGTMGQPHSKFAHGNIDVYGYKLFLNSLLSLSEDETVPPSLEDLLKTLRAVNEVTFQQLCATYEQADYFNKLSSRTDNINDPFKLARDNDKSNDPIYNQLAEFIYFIYEPMDNNKNKPLTEIIEDYRVKTVAEVKALDTIGVTSDTHSEGGNKIDKYITPSGMSALFAPLAAFSYANYKNGNYKDKDFRIKYDMAKYSYFELSGWENSLSERLSKKDKATPNILYMDNNPCVNTIDKIISPLKIIKECTIGQNGKTKRTHIPDILVIDVTSSTMEQIQRIRAAWKDSKIPALAFASSGLKNKQFGLDLAQYGECTLEINANADENKKQLLNTTKDYLRAITQASSSVYSTHMRREFKSVIQRWLSSKEQSINELSSASASSDQNNNGVRTSRESFVYGERSLFEKVKEHSGGNVLTTTAINATLNSANMQQLAGSSSSSNTQPKHAEENSTPKKYYGNLRPIDVKASPAKKENMEPEKPRHLKMH